MCDWSIGRRDVSSFELGKQIGLDGIQVSVGEPPDNLYLRDPKAQKTYLETAKKHGMTIASTAMGILNHIPLMSEPRAALWTADTIEITKNLGTRVILLAFFHKGELREENKEDMRRVTEVLIELAPRAEKAGVILGLENYLTAEANLKILEQVKSKAVQVYYDVYNSASKDHDVIREIKLLGPHICQVHIKEGHQLLGTVKGRRRPGSSTTQIDWPAVAAALKEVGYRDWIILETSSPTDVITDTRANLEYVRKVFAPLA